MLEGARSCPSVLSPSAFGTSGADFSTDTRRRWSTACVPGRRRRLVSRTLGGRTSGGIPARLHGVLGLHRSICVEMRPWSERAVTRTILSSSKAMLAKITVVLVRRETTTQGFVAPGDAWEPTWPTVHPASQTSLPAPRRSSCGETTSKKGRLIYVVDTSATLLNGGRSSPNRGTLPASRIARSASLHLPPPARSARLANSRHAALLARPAMRSPVAVSRVSSATLIDTQPTEDQCYRRPLARRPTPLKVPPEREGPLSMPRHPPLDKVQPQGYMLAPETHLR